MGYPSLIASLFEASCKHLCAARAAACTTPYLHMQSACQAEGLLWVCLVVQHERWQPLMLASCAVLHAPCVVVTATAVQAHTESTCNHITVSFKENLSYETRPTLPHIWAARRGDT